MSALNIILRRFAITHSTIVDDDALNWLQTTATTVWLLEKIMNEQLSPRYIGQSYSLSHSIYAMMEVHQQQQQQPIIIDSTRYNGPLCTPSVDQYTSTSSS